MTAWNKQIMHYLQLNDEIEYGVLRAVAELLAERQEPTAKSVYQRMRNAMDMEVSMEDVHEQLASLQEKGFIIRLSDEGPSYDLAPDRLREAVKDDFRQAQLFIEEMASQAASREVAFRPIGTDRGIGKFLGLFGEKLREVLADPSCTEIEVALVKYSLSSLVPSAENKKYVDNLVHLADRGVKLEIYLSRTELETDKEEPEERANWIGARENLERILRAGEKKKNVVLYLCEGRLRYLKRVKVGLIRATFKETADGRSTDRVKILSFMSIKPLSKDSLRYAGYFAEDPDVGLLLWDWLRFIGSGTTYARPLPTADALKWVGGLPK